MLLIPYIIWIFISIQNIQAIPIADDVPLTRQEFTDAASQVDLPVGDNREGGGGDDLFEGDIDLDGHPLDYYKDSFPVGDECPPTDDPFILCNAQRDRSYRWPNAEVPYAVSRALSESDRIQIAKAIVNYEDLTCIKFVPFDKDKHRDLVYFIKDRGCWSTVGRRGGVQKLSIGRGCAFSGIVQHEMMHALGFFHEQSRADRDQYVTINWDNIPTSKHNNFEKYSLDRITHLNTDYDYGSIMHYGTDDFTRNGRDTITPLKSGARIGQRDGLSDNDAVKLNRMYCNGFETTDELGTSPQRQCTDQYSLCSSFQSACWAIEKYCCETCTAYANDKAAEDTSGSEESCEEQEGDDSAPQPTNSDNDDESSSGLFSGLVDKGRRAWRRAKCTVKGYAKSTVG